MAVWRGVDVHGYRGTLGNLLSWVYAQTTAPGPTRRPRIGANRAAVPVYSMPAVELPRGTPPLIPRPAPTAPSPFPGGTSIPDRIPGRVALPGFGTLLSRLLGLGVGALFYPTEAGRGSDLCRRTRYGVWCETPTVAAVPAAVPSPARGPRRRGRVVPGTVAPPRRRERPRAPPAPVARPSSGPVTISRPRAIPQVRVAEAVLGIPPGELPLPAPSSSSSSTSSSTRPAPATSSLPTAAPATSSLPALGAVVLPAIGAWVSSPATFRVGEMSRPTRERQRDPSRDERRQPSPQLAPQLAPLTSFRAAPALSPAQELDRQCRERAKQKRKKRKPRTECYRGTYTETRSGTLKRRKEKIRCQ